MGINIAADYGCDHTVTTTVTRLLIADNQTGVLGGIDGGRHGATWLRDNTIRDNTGNGILATHIRPFHVIGNQITRNGGDGVYAFEDSVDRLEDNMISHNGGDGAEFQDSVAHVVDNRFMHNAGAGMILFERLCGFRSLYDITGNTALHNGGGGLSAAFSDCDDPLVPPPGDGNVAKRNETFQCILIRCMPGGNSGPDGAGGAREPVGRWLSITSH